MLNRYLLLLHQLIMYEFDLHKCQKFRKFQFEPDTTKALIFMKLLDNNCPRESALKYSKRRLCRFDATKKHEGPPSHRIIKNSHPHAGWVYPEAINYDLGPNYEHPKLEEDRDFQTFFAKNTGHMLEQQHKTLATMQRFLEDINSKCNLSYKNLDQLRDSIKLLRLRQEQYRNSAVDYLKYNGQRYLELYQIYKRHQGEGIVGFDKLFPDDVKVKQKRNEEFYPKIQKQEPQNLQKKFIKLQNQGELIARLSQQQGIKEGEGIQIVNSGDAEVKDLAIQFNKSQYVFNDERKRVDQRKKLLRKTSLIIQHKGRSLKSISKPTTFQEKLDRMVSTRMDSMTSNHTPLDQINYDAITLLQNVRQISINIEKQDYQRKGAKKTEGYTDQSFVKIQNFYVYISELSIQSSSILIYYQFLCYRVPVIGINCRFWKQKQTLYLEAKAILQKYPRSDEQNRVIEKATRNFKYFQELLLKSRQQYQALHQETCKYLHYRKFEPGEIIVKQGDPADRFFIIFGGKVNIYQTKRYLEMELQETARSAYQPQDDQKKRHSVVLIQRALKIKTQKSAIQQQIALTKLRSDECYKSILLETGGLFPDQFQDFEYFFQLGLFTQNFINQLHQGEAFGDLGLLVNQQRSASVVAFETVEVGYIVAEDYKFLLQQAQSEVVREVVSFLNHYFFPNIPISQCTSISYNFNKLNLQRGQYLYKEGEVGHSLFIVKEGEVETYCMQSGQKVYLGILIKGSITGDLEYFNECARVKTAIVTSELCQLLELPFFQFTKLIEQIDGLEKLCLDRIIQKQELMKLQLYRSASMKLKLNPPEIEETKDFHEPNSLVRKLASQIEKQRQKGLLPTQQGIILEQQELHKSLKSIQENQLKLKKLVFKKHFLMPFEEEKRLKEGFKRSQIIRSIFNEKDTSKVDRKDVISFTLKNKRNSTRHDTDNSQSSISKVQVDQSTNGLEQRNSCSPPRKRIIVSSKHNLFRQRPDKYFIYYQNYFAISRGSKN